MVIFYSYVKLPEGISHDIRNKSPFIVGGWLYLINYRLSHFCPINYYPIVNHDQPL